MLGIGCPDRHALPRRKRADRNPWSLPRERVRSSARSRRPPPGWNPPGVSGLWGRAARPAVHLAAL